VGEGFALLINPQALADKRDEQRGDVRDRGAVRTSQMTVTKMRAVTE
jgi:hypothetical protein